MVILTPLWMSEDVDVEKKRTMRLQLTYEFLLFSIEYLAARVLIWQCIGHIVRFSCRFWTVQHKRAEWQDLDIEMLSAFLHIRRLKVTF